MFLDNCGVASALKNSPSRDNLISNFSKAIETLRIDNTSIQSIGKSLSLFRAIFIMFFMMFAHTLDFQKSLITTVASVIDSKIHFIIELFLRVEHQDEHLLVGRGCVGSVKGKKVAQKPSDTEYFWGLFLLLGLVWIAWLGQGYDRARYCNVEDYGKHHGWDELGFHC